MKDYEVCRPSRKVSTPQCSLLRAADKYAYILVVEALLVSLPKEKRTSMYVCSTFLASLPPCHLGPAQLNPQLPLYS